MLDKDVTGTVFNVQKFSVHDGKGIRTLVFLKGCPLRCRWCSNPESQARPPERAFNPQRCLGPAACGRCLEACPSGAMSLVDGQLRDDRSRCDACHACVEACPSGAQSLYGETWSVDRVLRRVEEDGVFYARSGGGLTLSGGEAMTQPDFVLPLLREAKARRINTAMETCGHCDGEALVQACSLLDALIFDIKSLDDAKHKAFIGVGNQLILENFRRVCDRFPGLPILVRTPVIPGFNDTEADVLAIRDILPRRASVRYELLPYHRMGQPKYGYLGRTYPMDGVQQNGGAVKLLQLRLKTCETLDKIVSSADL